MPGGPVSPPLSQKPIGELAPPARRDECSPQAGSGARTTEALYEAMGEALKQVCPQDSWGGSNPVAYAQPKTEPQYYGMSARTGCGIRGIPGCWMSSGKSPGVQEFSGIASTRLC